MDSPQTPQDLYSAAFAELPAAESKATKALTLALDVRKFEIELYWKRAAYFSVFTGAALAAHLAALTGKDVQNQADALLLTSCIGLVFAVAWYLVNRASKFWQANWEAHVDLLEDDVHGPLYKTVLSKAAAWWKPHDPYLLSCTEN